MQMGNWIKIPIAIKGVGCWLLVPSAYYGISQLPSKDEKKLHFKIGSIEFEVFLPPEIANANPEKLAGTSLRLIPDGIGFVLELRCS